MMRTEYTENGGFLQRDSVEHKEYAEAYSANSREAEEKDGADLLEKVLSRDNLNRAYKRVKANKGASGVDGMTVNEAGSWLKEHKGELLEKIRNGKYKPSPVRRVEIPKKAKDTLKRLTSRSQGRKLDYVLHNIKVYMQGWLNYYGIAEMKSTMEDWNGWLRRRIRMYIWKQWKKPKTRVENLKKLGMPKWQAYRNGNTRKGYWAVAGSGILSHTITNERLARRGYYDISEAYKSMHSI